MNYRENRPKIFREGLYNHSDNDLIGKCFLKKILNEDISYIEISTVRDILSNCITVRDGICIIYGSSVIFKVFKDDKTRYAYEMKDNTVYEEIEEDYFNYYWNLISDDFDFIKNDICYQQLSI